MDELHTSTNNEHQMDSPPLSTTSNNSNNQLEIIPFPSTNGGIINIVLGNVLGEGTFAKVRSGSIQKIRRPHPHKMIEKSSMSCKRPSDERIIVDSTTTIAVKCIAKNDAQNNAHILKAIENEKKVLDTCSNLRYVVKMYGSIDTQHTHYLILEYCAGGDLYTTLSNEGIERNDALHFILEIASALDCLHKINVLYHDLKPENICLDVDGHIKLVDFGMAQLFDETHFNIYTGRYEIISSGGTAEYCAPEIYWRMPHSFEADWWSFGVLAYEFLCGGHPYEFHGTLQEQCNYICSDASFHRNDTVSPGSLEESFLSKFLVKNPSQRFGYHNIDMNEIKSHLVFNELNMYAQCEDPIFCRA